MTMHLLVNALSHGTGEEKISLKTAHMSLVVCAFCVVNALLDRLDTRRLFEYCVTHMIVSPQRKAEKTHGGGLSDPRTCWGFTVPRKA